MWSEVESGRNPKTLTLLWSSVTCKNEENAFKNEGDREVTTVFPSKSIGIVPDAQWQLTRLSGVSESDLIEIRTYSLL